jgi:hypothetical protein
MKVQAYLARAVVIDFLDEKLKGQLQFYVHQLPFSRTPRVIQVVVLVPV